MIRIECYKEIILILDTHYFVFVSAYVIKDPFQENSHESDSSTNVVAGYLNLEYMNKHFLFICISLPHVRFSWIASNIEKKFLIYCMIEQRW